MLLIYLKQLLLPLIIINAKKMCKELGRMAIKSGEGVNVVDLFEATVISIIINV